MANLTAKYNVTISGWQGKAVMADDTIKETWLFCMADKNYLESTLQAMQDAGEIKSFEINWVTVVRQAG